MKETFMKITKSQLKQIIKEEIENSKDSLNEIDDNMLNFVGGLAGGFVGMKLLGPHVIKNLHKKFEELSLQWTLKTLPAILLSDNNVKQLVMNYIEKDGIDDPKQNRLKFGYKNELTKLIRLTLKDKNVRSVDLNQKYAEIIFERMVEMAK